MVPLTCFAFYWAQLTLPRNIEMVGDGPYAMVFYVAAVSTCCVGVFLYNWFEEKKQKANTEEF